MSFFTKNDPNDPRLGEKVLPLNNNTHATLLESAVVITGYPDDEGIRNNGGRVGAAGGPERVRQFLYQMTPPYMGTLRRTFDSGDISIEGPLESRHSNATQRSLGFLNQGASVLAIGGGHDYGYADSSAFAQWCEKLNQKSLIINFDAHLDVRETKNGMINSGTPFRRLLENHSNCQLYQIGMQRQCNSTHDWKWALEKGAQILSFDEINLSGEDEEVVILRFLEPALLRRRPVYISVDIDAFSSAYAPGCSQSWPTGLNPNRFFKILEVLMQKLDVRSMGIYEVAPALDNGVMTSRLASLIAYRFLTEK